MWVSHGRTLDFAAPATRGWLHVTTWQGLSPELRAAIPPAGALRTLFTRYVGLHTCDNASLGGNKSETSGDNKDACNKAAIVRAVQDLTGSGNDMTPLPAVLLSIMAEELVVQRREEVLARIPRSAVRHCAIGPPGLDDCFGIIHDTATGGAPACSVFRSRTPWIAMEQIRQLATVLSLPFPHSPQPSTCPSIPATVYTSVWDCMRDVVTIAHAHACQQSAQPSLIQSESTRLMQLTASPIHARIILTGPVD